MQCFGIIGDIDVLRVLLKVAFDMLEFVEQSITYKTNAKKEKNVS